MVVLYGPVILNGPVVQYCVDQWWFRVVQYGPMLVHGGPG